MAEKLNSMPCIYILYSRSKNRFYVGSTRDDRPFVRLDSHNHGKVRSTKAGRPWALTYQEYYSNYHQARKREIFLKSGVGRTWIKEKFPNLKNDGAGAETWVSG
ncbi:MAG: GIY-YIG nuclease family protein [Candidatus Sungiibacteriota bacterium]|uniref:GIY-YIG nuclease family protein n=1 Tax=Candidatus Sungiibacteriota bacterium TaxID=2750080 RepID=A0A7T5USE1_9BACT|nr:MAG: GIY-YIG nuclease family protein [Candidatus Sungbacteria bacterium]